MNEKQKAKVIIETLNKINLKEQVLLKIKNIFILLFSSSSNLNSFIVLGTSHLES